MEKTELTFNEILDRIFHEERVPIHLLYRLSDLTVEQDQAFDAQWYAATDDRRAVISRHMADITEDNFVVDFTLTFRKFLDDPYAEVRLAALDGLWDVSKVSLIRPVSMLMKNDQDERVRAQAAATLGHIVLMAEWGQINSAHTEQIVEAMIEEYNRPETPAKVRWSMLEAMSVSADERIPGFIHAAYYDGDEATQLSAVVAMGRHADNRWLPIVLEELESPNMEMRLEAAQAAGEIASSEAVEPLLLLLNDEELEVQLAAIYALGKIGSDLAQEVLQDLLNDPGGNETLQEAAEVALEEMTWLGGEIDLALLAVDELDDEDDWIQA